MRRLVVFEQLSLDGYYMDRDGDMSWAKVGTDAESQAFATANASGDGILAFGRATYELMAANWPSDAMQSAMPEMAGHMNRRPKIVFSKSLREATWNNTAVVAEDPVTYLRRIKDEAGPDITILGSGRVVASLAPHGIIDEYQFMLCPRVLGSGRTLFEGVPEQMRFVLQSSRVFKNNKIFLTYTADRNEGSPA